MGQRVEKFATNWCLLSRMEALGTLLAKNDAWNFNHVKRVANKLSNLMENVGVGGGHGIREASMQALERENWVDRCHHLDRNDHVVIGWKGRDEKVIPSNITCQHANGKDIPHLL